MNHPLDVATLDTLHQGILKLAADDIEMSVEAREAFIEGAGALYASILTILTASSPKENP
jgi:hypothetical protein